MCVIVLCHTIVCDAYFGCQSISTFEDSMALAHRSGQDLSENENDHLDYMILKFLT